MKLVIVFTSILMALNFTAHAADVFAKCYTKDFATTTFVVETVDGIVNAEVFNHNGGEYAPFWDSTVVPNDLTILAKKADIIKQINKGFKTSWKTEKCKWGENNMFSCFGSTEKIQVGNLEVKPWTLYSTAVKTASAHGTYEHIEMSIRFDVGSESLHYTMEYPVGECILSQTKIEKIPSKK